MKYNAKYDRWVSKDGLVYRYDKRLDKLILCKIGSNGSKHCTVYTKLGKQYLHRVVYETFYGDIQKDMVIDHKDNNPLNNNFENLQCVSRKMNNEFKFIRDKYIIKPSTDFGRAFKLKYGILKKDNPALYCRELRHWQKFGRLSNAS